jgi:hypothetical protein
MIANTSAQHRAAATAYATTTRCQRFTRRPYTDGAIEEEAR